MKLPWILFALSLSMCVLLGVVFSIEEEPFEEVASEDGTTVEKVYKGHGFPHPEFPAMQAGGPGAPRHEKILWLGWVFAILQVAFLVTCLALGASRKGRVGPFAVPLALGGLLMAAVFTFLILSYRAYMTEDSHSLFLSLPRPTAWMVYGVWGFPVFFMLLYILTFKRWFMTEEDLERFREIVAAKRRDDAEGA